MSNILYKKSFDEADSEVGEKDFTLKLFLKYYADKQHQYSGRAFKLYTDFLSEKSMLHIRELGFESINNSSKNKGHFPAKYLKEALTAPLESKIAESYFGGELQD